MERPGGKTREQSAWRPRGVLGTWASCSRVADLEKMDRIVYRERKQDEVELWEGADTALERGEAEWVKVGESYWRNEWWQPTSQCSREATRTALPWPFIAPTRPLPLSHQVTGISQVFGWNQFRSNLVADVFDGSSWK